MKLFSKCLPSQNSKRSFYLLLSLSFFLGVIESLFPKPLPFMRLGLTNIPIMLALPILPFPSYLLLVFCKLLISAYVSGTLFSPLFLMGLAGSIVSALIMALFYYLGRRHQLFSWVALSVAGGVSHSLAQIAIGGGILFGGSVWKLFGLLLPLSVFTSLVTGIWVSLIDFNECLTWANEKLAQASLSKQNSASKGTNKPISWSSRLLLVITLLLVVAAAFFFFGVKVWWWVVIAALVLLILRLAVARGWKTIGISLASFIGIVLINLIEPNGRLLFEIGSWKICEGALFEGIRRGAAWVGWIQLSKIGVVVVQQQLRLGMNSDFGQIMSLVSEFPGEVVASLFGSSFPSLQRWIQQRLDSKKEKKREKKNKKASD